MRSASVTAELKTSSLLCDEPELPSLVPAASEKGQKGTKLRVVGLKGEEVNGEEADEEDEEEPEVDGDDDEEGDKKRCLVWNDDDVQ